MIGDLISHYKILEQLGRGGMGVVYKARDTKLDRYVALKFLPPHLGADEVEKQRFMHEAKSASALDHPNVATIYEINETPDGQMYIAMAHYDGETLKDKIAKGPLSVQEAVDITLQIVQGLAKVHEQGIIHRDIKPANILVLNDGTVKIVDFGLAMLTDDTRYKSTGRTIGTAAYISPEQVRGESVDERSDIWSLGVVLYELLTGKRPFEAEYEQTLMLNVLNESHVPASQHRHDLPKELDRIINRCLEKALEQRCQSVDNLLEDLTILKSRFEPRQRPLARAGLWAAVVLMAVLIFIGQQFLFVSDEAIDSIAVIPFQNVTGDQETEYLTDGIAESINIGLSQLRNLKVIAMSSAQHFKGKTVDPQTIGQELDVHTVLTGKGLHRENNLIFTLELADARDNSLIWGGQYQRSLSEIFAVQEDILGEISRELQLELTTEEKDRLTKRYTESSEAYQLYLKGRYFWNKRTKQSFEKAIQYFEQAIAKDTNYALAYVGLADVYSLFPQYGGEPKTSYPKAKEAAMKALTLDSTLAEAQAALGLVKRFYDWNLTQEEQYLKRAIMLKPGYAVAHHYYAASLSSRGQMDAAIASSKKAVSLDPISPYTNRMLGIMFFMARRYDEAIDQWQKTLTIHPNRSALLGHIADAYLQKSMHKQATNILKKADSLGGYNNPEIKAKLCRAYALTGQQKKARSILESLLENSNHVSILPHHIATIYGILDEKDEAFKWLEKAWMERDFWTLWLKVDPFVDNLRSDARFTAFVKKVGLDR